MLLAAAVVVTLAAAAGPASADEARDFIGDARVFYRVVSCGGTAPLPADVEQATVDKHCVAMAKLYDEWQKTYVKPASEFFASLRPSNLPANVVYPFGGGDLGGALVTYPEARDITTISLEHSGDPTRLAHLKKGELRESLGNFRAAIDGLLTLHDSTSENMMKLESGGIPGQLSFHITGMTAMGYEPVSLKFFKLNDDGTIHYLTQAEIDALAKKTAKKIKNKWVDTDFSEAFNNMELTFRKAGDVKAPVVVHRHIAWNLGDKAFKNSPLEKYLVAKGKIAAMTKAASYLIWDGGFSGIRDYLLANMVWMASDSTGIPPRYAKKAGFVQTTYGMFTAPFLDEANQATGDAMVKLWASQPHRKLPFRYGYPDKDKHLHLMITSPAPAPPAADKKDEKKP
jgi:hypothetical protein